MSELQLAESSLQHRGPIEGFVVSTVHKETNNFSQMYTQLYMMSLCTLEGLKVLAKYSRNI